MRLKCDTNLCEMCSHYNECTHEPYGSSKVDRRAYYKAYDAKRREKRLAEYQEKKEKELKELFNA